MKFIDELIMWASYFIYGRIYTNSNKKSNYESLIILNCEELTSMKIKFITYNMAGVVPSI